MLRFVRCCDTINVQFLKGMIIDTIFTLEEMPERIKLVNDERLARKQIRGLYVNNYTVFFRINKPQNMVVIVRVLYSHRDWSALL